MCDQINVVNYYARDAKLQTAIYDVNDISAAPFIISPS